MSDDRLDKSRTDAAAIPAASRQVKELHGTMTIGDRGGTGTTLTIHLPVPVAFTEVPLARAAG